MALIQGGNRTAIIPGPPTGGGTVYPGSTFLVSTKETATSEWVPQPNLIPLNATYSLAPSISTAYFRYDFGDRTTEVDPNYVTLAALGLTDHYVKIEMFSSDSPSIPIFIWDGQLVHDGRRPHGVQPPTATGIPAGQQMFTAYGLEHLLTKIPIDRSRVLLNGKVFWVQRPMTFNRRGDAGSTIVGNLAIEPDTDQAPIFAPTGTRWDYEAILVYLARNFLAPVLGPQVHVITPPGTVGPRAVESLYGLSVYDAINKMLDRRRGWAWYVRSGAGTVSVFEIVVVSTLTDAVVAGDIVLPANPITTQIDVDEDIRVTNFLVNKSSTNRYSAIQVRGGPIKVMMSLSIPDTTLEAAWTPEDDGAYKDAAKGSAGYDGLTLTDKARRNDAFRRQYSLVKHVYRRFKLPQSWDGFVGSGLGQNNGEFNAIPRPHEILGKVFIVPETPGTFYAAEKGFLSQLLTDQGKDYSVSPPVDITPSGIDPELASPFVTFFHFVGAPGSLVWFHLGHLMGSTAGDNLPTIGMRMLNNELGFELSTSGSAMPHALDWDTESGNNNWSDFAEPTLYNLFRETTVDYAKMIATVALELDWRPYMVVNMAAGPIDNAATLVLDFPGLQFWYGVPGTVLGVDDRGGDVKRLHQANKVLRDDTPELRALAAFVFAWYGRERRGVRLTRKRFDNPQIGTILRSVAVGQSQTQVNSLISALEYDFLEASTTIVTDHQELDFAGLFGGSASVTGGSTPSTGPIRHAVRTADARLERLEQLVKKLPVHPAGESSGIVDGFLGKVTAYYQDRCHVARMLYGDPEDWANAVFSGDVVKCVWKGVGTAIVPGDPVFCFRPTNSSKYVAMPWFNDVGDWADAGGSDGEFQFCEPSAGDVVDPGDSCNEPDPPFDPEAFNDCTEVP